jgi:Cytochrome c3/Cytochrome c7 and related cytochrome c
MVIRRIWGAALIMSVELFAIQPSAAQDIESLVMPGPVSEAHVEAESECANCHQRFKKSAQRELCLDCHEDVAEDLAGGSGFHGRNPDVGTEQCSDCHTEHEGRDADILGLDEDNFDHQFTDFELLGKHADVACADCHTQEKHRDAPSDCVGCHRDDDVHKETMGSDCADCHNALDWTDAEFDHETTGWPLLGKHAEVACNDCHEDQTYLGAPSNCFGCHAEDDAHDGRSGNRCEDCHSPTSWNDSRFDHTRDTDFPLLGKHALLTCDDCHSENPFSDQIDSGCISCHLEDDSHEGHNGENCESCHAFDDWAESTFDHDTDTDYVLRGGHRDVACNDCHIEPIFEQSPGTACADCHLDDDAHDGTLGTDCAACHTEVSWEDAVFFDHDLTSFPLLGAHSDVECEDCHKDKAFASTESDCVSCHREDDVHDGHFHERCGDCHNPVDWKIWTFDHDVQTVIAVRW